MKENNRFVRWFKETYREVEGKEVEITYGGASVGGDFNYFGTYLGRPTLVFGPIGGNWHSADEWVSVSSVRRVKGIYLRFLRALAGLR
ncbi:M20/M25/M40 family metallo-hydrolase [Thermococcus sp. JCM 11816]|uniref:M20/M25/M40 family metallo-hydrolase n=1 Tax=Thermococcus sp. (strain JCM 11816 / KS-1) TaxID=1295125 RepID=UPI000B254A11